MLEQPPDEYKGKFPPDDPRLPELTAAHESFLNSLGRYASHKQTQQSAMEAFDRRNAGLVDLHKQRLGILSDGNVMPGAPVAMEWYDAEEGDEDEEDEPQLEPRNPFYRGQHHLIPGLVGHASANTMLEGDKWDKKPTEKDDETDHPGKPTIVQDTKNGVKAGWKHMKPVGEALGGAAAATAVGLGYAGAGLTSLGSHGIRGAGHLLGNMMRGREAEEDEPEARPKPPAPPPASKEESGQPVPPFLLDLPERMKAARKGPNLGSGRFTNGEIDRRFREKEIKRTGYGVGMP